MVNGRFNQCPYVDDDDSSNFETGAVRGQVFRISSHENGAAPRLTQAAEGQLSAKWAELPTPSDLIRVSAASDSKDAESNLSNHLIAMWKRDPTRGASRWIAEATQSHCRDWIITAHKRLASWQEIESRAEPELLVRRKGAPKLFAPENFAKTVRLAVYLALFFVAAGMELTTATSLALASKLPYVPGVMSAIAASAIFVIGPFVLFGDALENATPEGRMKLKQTLSRYSFPAALASTLAFAFNFGKLATPRDILSELPVILPHWMLVGAQMTLLAITMVAIEGKIERIWDSLLVYDRRDNPVSTKAAELSDRSMHQIGEATALQFRAVDTLDRLTADKVEFVQRGLAELRQLQAEVAAEAEERQRQFEEGLAKLKRQIFPYRKGDAT